MLIWQNFHLWQRKDFGKSSPQQTHIKLDKTVTNNHFRAPKIDQRQTTNREALIDENLPRLQERTVGVYGLLAQSCFHHHYLVQQTGMVALAVRLDWKSAASLQERVHLIWSRQKTYSPTVLSVKAANCRKLKGKSHSPANLRFQGRGKARKEFNKEVVLEMRTCYKKISPHISNWLGKLHVQAGRVESAQWKVKVEADFKIAWSLNVLPTQPTHTLTGGEWQPKNLKCLSTISARSLPQYYVIQIEQWCLYIQDKNLN